ncbi:MAG TPA: EAL domain-containing protein [Nocardioides sp.]|nr:EAL domain-containing protein [Nocardioides sp.]
MSFTGIPTSAATGFRAPDDGFLLQVVEAAPNAMILVDTAGRIVLVNSEAERSFGYGRDELLGMSVERLVPERLRSAHRTSREVFLAHPDRRSMGAGRELFGLRKDGTEMQIEIGLNPIVVGADHYVLASIIDITQRLIEQAVEASLRADELRRSILDSIPFSIIVTDPLGRIVEANPAAAQLLRTTTDELVGSSLHDIDGGTRPRDQLPRFLDHGEGEEDEWTYRRRDGTPVPVTEAIVPLRDEGGEITGFLAVAYDITKRIEARARVQHMANHDSLTNLPNRTLIIKHLVGSMNAADPGDHVTLLLLDLDHFKRVNDSLGHHAGDRLLLAVTERLQAWAGSDGLVGRLGGDEFVVVFGPSQPPVQVRERARELVADLLTQVEVDGHQIVVTASIGGAVYPDDGTDPSTLLKHADIAMYDAKESGRSNLQWFVPAMLEATNDKISLAAALRQALGESELSLHYQPLVDLRSGAVVGLEALARWNSPLHGAVGPDRFIPVAEEGGMITQFGRWVLRQACTDGVAIQGALGRPLRIAVNVSPRQFHHDWLTEVKDALDLSGLDPASLELEITEGMLLEDQRDVVEVMQAIRELGVKIVVDDFGQGYSSLAYLTRFPIDRLKIDRAFVQQLGPARGDADAAVVDAIIAMAHALGITVVAEGVETDEQATYLRDRGCEEAQGYRYSPGVAADEVVAVARAIGV